MATAVWAASYVLNAVGAMDVLSTGAEEPGMLFGFACLVYWSLMIAACCCLPSKLAVPTNLALILGGTDGMLTSARVVLEVTKPIVLWPESKFLLLAVQLLLWASVPRRVGQFLRLPCLMRVQKVQSPAARPTLQEECASAGCQDGSLAQVQDTAEQGQMRCTSQRHRLNLGAQKCRSRSSRAQGRRRLPSCEILKRTRHALERCKRMQAATVSLQQRLAVNTLQQHLRRCSSTAQERRLEEFLDNLSIHLRDGLVPPAHCRSRHWDWPLSRQEMKTYVLLTDREVLLGEITSLRHWLAMS